MFALRKAIAVPELLFGLWLLSGLRPVMTRRLAIGCFAVFSCFALTLAIQGAESCGCFGRAPVSPWFTLLFDLSTVALLLYFRPGGDGHIAPLTSPWRVTGLAAWFITVASIVGFATAFSPRYASVHDLAPTSGGIVLLDPSEWIGQKFDLAKHIIINFDLSKGRWTVVLYHHDCSTCQEVIPRYERLASLEADQPDAPRIALIEVPPYASPGSGLVKNDSACVFGRLRDSNEWFVRTPAAITLRDGIVLPPIDALSRIDSPPREVANRPTPGSAERSVVETP